MEPGLGLALTQLANGQAQIATDVSALRADTSKAITKLEVLETRVSEARLGDIETRLRLLERFRYTLLGISLVGGILAGFAGYYIGHLVKLWPFPTLYRQFSKPPATLICERL